MSGVQNLYFKISIRQTFMHTTSTPRLLQLPKVDVKDLMAIQQAPWPGGNMVGCDGELELILIRLFIDFEER